MYGRTWVRLASIDHLCSSCYSLSIQVLHIGNLLTLVFRLGCAFAPNTGALVGFRFLGEHSTSLLSLQMLSRLQLDYQQVDPQHAVELLLEIYLRVTNEDQLWRCTFLDPLLVRMPDTLTCAPDPIFRPHFESYRWGLHCSNGGHQMGIHHQCQFVFIHCFMT